MSRTIRRTYKGEPVRDGQWTARCPEGHDCTWCGPAASLPYKVARRSRDVEVDEPQVRTPAWYVAEQVEWMWDALDLDDWYGWSLDDSLYWMGLTWNVVLMKDADCPCGLCVELEDEAFDAWASIDSMTFGLDGTPVEDDHEVQVRHCRDCGFPLRDGRCVLSGRPANVRAAFAVAA